MQAETTAPLGLRLEVEYPQRLSRIDLLLKSFLGWLYVDIPHGLALYLLGILAGVVQVIAFVAILVTGRYPAGLFNFMVGYLRWSVRYQAYRNLLLTDSYPPLSLGTERYPLALEVERPERLSRGLAVLKLLLGWLYAGVPHGVALIVYGVVVAVTTFLSWFAILFTGRYPRPFFNLAVGILRWSARLNAYLYLMRDEYPPFHGRP